MSRPWEGIYRWRNGEWVLIHDPPVLPIPMDADGRCTCNDFCFGGCAKIESAEGDQMTTEIHTRPKPKPRPDLCPNCGQSVTTHTGTYCQNCGEVL